ncbi:hypothetical protein HS1genome_0696 [Sulfodiicoccus acidiphilus]|uniref:Uncharacterized protein n=1 Tax=Sulfodiicoccus acidiphilus TaxID=1670455 RepID=A0A348B2A5_9CREN|nr:hypothetical protein [Sulfodiicoccus acidiphilus]BBD72307.1 hypothetical protein HS1genome_0696 [Sulfodiicoccus acidiphilus]GGT90379.1 hypothetical protein GCM10007116_05240 [Sulfodiicoccus acidiphilus]
MLALSLVKGWVKSYVEEVARDKRVELEQIMGDLDPDCLSLLKAVLNSPALTEDLAVFVPKPSEEEFESLVAKVQVCLGRL